MRESSNEEIYKSLAENYKKVLKKLIRSIPKSDLINILQEMKIIGKYPLLKDRSRKRFDHVTTDGHKVRILEDHGEKVKIEYQDGVIMTAFKSQVIKEREEK